MDDYLAIALNLGSALVAGSLIGLERTYHGRPAGFRTHALVCVASALLMLLTTYQWQWLVGAPAEMIRADPTRIAQGIMTGIGFLGAGVIFREGLTVRGLTTAASIWMTAALGILYGAGLYYPAVLASVITLGILAVFNWFEKMVPSQLYAHHYLRFPKDKTLGEADVRRLLEGHGFAKRLVLGKTQVVVRGLTTAASIWMTAALGILYGAGLYYPAVLASVITLGILAVFNWFEKMVPSQLYAHHYLRFPKDKTLGEADVRRLLEGHGFAVTSMSYRLHGDGTVFEYRTVIKTTNRSNLARLAEDLRKMENTIGFAISPIGGLGLGAGGQARPWMRA